MPSFARLEPVAGLHVFLSLAAKDEQGLNLRFSFAADKLSPNGDGP